jgi:phenylalanyl-tRNA synthetase beta chain
MKVSYNWLQEYIDDKLPEASTVAEALTMHSFEIEGMENEGDDKVIDVKVLPNRAHDCLSHYGVASEVASVLKLKRKELLPKVEIPRTDKIMLFVNTKTCSRQQMILIKGVKVAESPEWLKNKLKVLGHRSINSIVDITNYLTYSFGQPMHAFDAGKVYCNSYGQYDMSVREAKDGEKITLLDGKEYTLKNTMMVIADHEKALDVAGVMGGKDSGVSMETVDIILSLSSFDPVSVRKTAKALGIRTDASQRFENEISQSLIDRVLPYALKHIAELAGGEVVGSLEINLEAQKQNKVDVTLAKISSMLGITLGADQVIELLARQDIAGVSSGEKITVTIPLERLDLKLPEDVVEEVGRLYGYENISPVALNLESPKEVNLSVFVSDSIRNILTTAGFSEIYNYAFTNGGEMEVENPLAGDKKFLRSNLALGIEKSLEYNFKFLDLLTMTDVRIFEIGKVFKEKGEALNLAIGVKLSKSKKSVNPDEEIAKTINLIEDKLGVSIGDVSIVGGVAEFDLSRVVSELGAMDEYPDEIWNAQDKNTVYKTISPFPFAVRDVAVFVPNEVSGEKVEELIKSHITSIVVRFSMFDKFVKADKTSYGFRLVFQSNDKTLTDDEINAVMNPVYDTLKAQQGFEIR